MIVKVLSYLYGGVQKFNYKIIKEIQDNVTSFKYWDALGWTGFGTFLLTAAILTPIGIVGAASSMAGCAFETRLSEYIKYLKFKRNKILTELIKIEQNIYLLELQNVIFGRNNYQDSEKLI